ncbi:S-adenosyl-L-methionine-dependent methyltransferase [Hyaloraphidium curvatum]|nr:S-adenosyl-L-methionine-dependent methyltransferase [Hyaloraphidium curvatum]
MAFTLVMPNRMTRRGLAVGLFVVFVYVVVNSRRTIHFTSTPDGFSTRQYPNIQLEPRVEYFYRATIHASPSFQLYVHPPMTDLHSGSIGQLGVDLQHREMVKLAVSAIEDIRKERVAKRQGGYVKVLDIGANLGTISFFIASQTGEHARVFAVEPLPAHAALFEKSLLIPENRGFRHRIKLYKVALSDSVAGGPAACLKSAFDDKSRTRVEAVKESAAGGFGLESCVYVAMTRLDDLLLNLKPDVVKLDVEGFERRVLEGGRQSVLGEHKPRLIMLEYEPRSLKAVTPDQDPQTLVTMLFELGYGEVRELEPSGNVTTYRTADEISAAFRTEAFEARHPVSGKVDLAFLRQPSP